MTFGAHKLVRSEPFLDYLYEFWQLLSALYSDVRKFFYIGMEVVRTNFSTDFWTFCNCNHNFTKIVAPPSNENENSLVPLKGKLLLKKRMKPQQNRPINHDAIPVRTMHLLNEQHTATEGDKQKQKEYKHIHFCT